MNNTYHDINQKILSLQQALTSNKNKVSFLLGAGCPLSIRVTEDGNNKPLIPDIKELTSIVLANISDDKSKQLVTEIPHKTNTSPTIEDILSKIRLMIEIAGTGQINGLTKNELQIFEKNICDQITNAVNKELPSNQTPYHDLATWINGISRLNAVEIFTPNYDLLMESALESKFIPYFDGFVGSKRAFFDLHSMENENLPARWVRLWKLHGSINWGMDKNGNIFRGNIDTILSAEDKQMIYPSHLKYSQSRRMPYLAMLDRLTNFLTKGQTVLITSGYSFVDQHLNEAIVQKLSANPNALCFGMLYEDIEQYPEAISCANMVSNLCLFAKDSGYFAGEKLKWGIENTIENKYEYLVSSDNDIIICHIGDFSKLCKFLIKQTGNLFTEAQNAS
ncbi:MAG: SIR2 family protein [Clostridia bacterium]